MNLIWDLIIGDNTCPHPYELQTLSTQGLGGTEATVIRIAEGLSAMGAKVGVIQHNLDTLLMGKNAYYIPIRMLDEIKTYNYVALRGTHHFNKFPKAKKFSWHEDLPTPTTIKMRDALVDHNVTVIGASKWHKGKLTEAVCDAEKQDNPRVTYIYNPVPDHLYIPKNVDIKYDKNKLVWIASPHKGIDKALEVFSRLVDVSGNKDFRLHVFNPGYFSDKEAQYPWLINHGSVPCDRLWQHVSESLCVFYPTTFEETFGCIAAEANAVHTPVLTSEIAALAETVSSRKQFVPANDPKAVIETVMRWHSGDRPVVWGNESFRLTKVLGDWCNLLQGTYRAE